MICTQGTGGGQCAACRELDPPTRGQADPGPPTLDELLAGLPAEIDRATYRRDRAKALMDEYRGDVAGGHAESLARTFGDRVKALHEELAVWRSYASAHPGAGQAPIGRGYECEHGRGLGRHPRCWDTEAKRYFNPGIVARPAPPPAAAPAALVREREPGDDDGEVAA